MNNEVVKKIHEAEIAYGKAAELADEARSLALKEDVIPYQFRASFTEFRKREDAIREVGEMANFPVNNLLIRHGMVGEDE